MQDIEFTVERGKLWMLQTRTGKRTAQAALKIAVSFVEEGRIGRDEAIRRIEPETLDQLLHPMLDPERKDDRAGARSAGLARRGVGQGRVFGRRSRSGGEPRRARDPGARRNQPRRHSRHARRARHSDDARRHDQPRRRCRARHGAALRRRRRRSAHRLRGRGRSPCAISIVRAGDIITINGSTGEVMLGEVPTIEPRTVGRFRDADGLGRRDAARSGSAPMPRPRSMPAPRAASAPRASGCRAPSTCSSRPTGSARCAR